MRIERLVIDSGERTLSTDFRPNLTVVAGLDPASRTALAGELLDALGGARPGVHLELEADGRSLTVFRPLSGAHRVVDTDAVADVTDQFLNPNGDIDLFSALGVDRSLGRNTIRFTRDDLVLRGESDAWVARLAALDQDSLWTAASRLTQTEQHLSDVAARSGTSTCDAAVVEGVEARHRELVEATEAYERMRLIALTIGTLGAIGGVASLEWANRLMAAPFLLATVVGLYLALSYRRRVNAAAGAEREVLAQTGADDYATFHSERVRSLLDDDDVRRQFMMAVSDHHEATDAWALIADGAPHRFAIEHESQIRAAAERRLELDPENVLDLVGLSCDTSTELAQVVLGRVEAVRALTGTENCLPLIVDDPFEGLDSSDKASLLDLLASLPETQQVIVLTADDEVVSWARLEEAAGRVAVSAPAIQRTATPTS